MKTHLPIPYPVLGRPPHFKGLPDGVAQSPTYKVWRALRSWLVNGSSTPHCTPRILGVSRQVDRSLEREYNKGKLTRQRNGELRYIPHT